MSNEMYISVPITFANPELLSEGELRLALECANRQTTDLWCQLEGYRTYLIPMLYKAVQAHIAKQPEQVAAVLDELAANYHHNVKRAKETRGVH
ncbi:MAG: hypothetical protein CMK74_22195 [Pseudomonadales bacterium]|nr:hypothetical protein [Pseudomonadales bacterium]|tara:strand:- start:569 stop:850 length:282 start_codon:yes stop_codon:yes gene_type:complete